MEYKTNINNTEFQKCNIFEDTKLSKLFIYSSINYNDPNEFANIIYHLYENTLIYTKCNEWYKFDDHIWRNITETQLINNIITPKLNEIYTKVLEYYNTDFEKYNAVIKRIKKIITNLNKSPFKKKIVLSLRALCSIQKTSQDFLEKLNANYNLLAFNNGIYDLQNFEFREGKPEDYISISINYNYSENHTEKYEELLKFLEDILPNEADRTYFLTYLGIALSGNKLEKIITLIGSGANAKSSFMNLLNTTLDTHINVIPSEYFTQLYPNQAWLNFRHKRIIYTEPKNDQKLNCGLIECFLHHIPLKKMYSNEILDVSFNFTPILLCNTEPKFDNIDHAFSQHLRCINFPTQFVNNPINDNQKKRIPDICGNFDHWKLDFMLLLIEYRKNYYKTGELIESDNILKLTKQY